MRYLIIVLVVFLTACSQGPKLKEVVDFTKWDKIELIKEGNPTILTEQEKKEFITLFGEAQMKPQLFLKDAANYYNITLTDESVKSVKSTNQRICLIKDLLLPPYKTDTTMFFEVVFELP